MFNRRTLTSVRTRLVLCSIVSFVIITSAKQASVFRPLAPSQGSHTMPPLVIMLCSLRAIVLISLLSCTPFSLVCRSLFSWHGRRFSYRPQLPIYYVMQLNIMSLAIYALIAHRFALQHICPIMFNCKTVSSATVGSGLRSECANVTIFRQCS